MLQNLLRDLSLWAPQAEPLKVEAASFVPPQSRIESLPTEVILIIYAMLPQPIDAACLALTCKCLYAKSDFRPKSRRVTMKDTPEILYRMLSQALVRFQEVPNEPLYQTAVPESILFGSSRHHYIMDWRAARLVTNSYFLGPRYGLRPSVLDVKGCWQISHGIHLAEPWRGRVHKRRGELLISCTRVYSGGEFASDEKLRRFLAAYRVEVCCHVGGFIEAGDFGPLHRDAFVLDGTPPVHGSCVKCHTDWSIECDRSRPEHGQCHEDMELGHRVVVIRTYHNLGDCRSTMNAKWHSMTDCRVPGTRLSAGAVENQWHASHVPGDKLDAAAVEACWEAARRRE
ncbi:uncharacterized protein B0I36DRAFT_363475 [Microdochium trichocladiopsis]|uniref:F-box domain-containing protein n=1 Tax=Microdochium trichocladiopsis TaxID=1682393 RepID=A0A9P8Y1S4_9PEZI|nr:uncharacterized protein B0I36DRAFT_363475 [Microdochium trichocladiopsis]KAH7028859.1 hypothetical protein B0I36DRAFT_363475 [Microdochium trichocladiopsis]